MKGRRPAWLIRLGLFLYDHLGGRRFLPGTSTLDLRGRPEGAPLEDRFAKAYEYSDCWVEDSRLVVLNARDAEERGAGRREQIAVSRGIDDRLRKNRLAAGFAFENGPTNGGTLHDRKGRSVRSRRWVVPFPGVTPGWDITRIAIIDRPSILQE